MDVAFLIVASLASGDRRFPPRGGNTLKTKNRSIETSTYFPASCGHCQVLVGFRPKSYKQLAQPRGTHNFAQSDMGPRHVRDVRLRVFTRPSYTLLTSLYSPSSYTIFAASQFIAIGGDKPRLRLLLTLSGVSDVVAIGCWRQWVTFVGAVMATMLVAISIMIFKNNETYGYASPKLMAEKFTALERALSGNPIGFRK